MKFLKYFLITLASVAAGALAGSLWQSSQNIKLIKNDLPVNEEKNIDFSYILRDHNGSLAVFRGNSPNPFNILEYQTDFLNEYDRNLVSEGISVPDEVSMRILIEDLTG